MYYFKKTLQAIVIAFILATTPSHAATQSFDVWLQGLRQEALRKGISQTTVNSALSGIRPQSRIIELDRKQPEGKLTFAQYKKRIISQQRIDKGRAMYRKHRKMLEVVAEHYGVPAQYIVALWGIETSYGAITGGFNVIEALATLAHDGRRSEFFRSELFNALRILDQGHIPHNEMLGSWAGAMGQNQFMPSSFFSFAVDGNGDGRRDIWTSLPDVFASTANYLSKSGWKADERWGRKVHLTQPIPAHLTGRDVKLPLSQWKAMGVKTAQHFELPVVRGMKASLVQPDGAGGESYLAYQNYDVIMKWNRSLYFATSVGLLADLIAIEK